MSLNIISAYQNVKIEDQKRQYLLTSDFIKYSVNNYKIISEGNSQIVNLKDQTKMIADNFDYNISKNIIIANKNVIFENRIKNYKIFSNKITYFKNDEKINTNGDTSAEINSKYFIKSKNVTFLQNLMELSSNSKTIIEDNHNIYSTSSFKYNIKYEFLKGNKITINSNYKKPNTDKYYFENGMISLKEQNFIAGKTEV